MSERLQGGILMDIDRRTFEDAFERIAFERPALHRNLILFPVMGGAFGNGSNGSVKSLHQGVQDRDIEILDTGKVEAVRVLNHSPGLVLGVNGQEVLGGYQNRILNFSVLFEPRCDRVVPAICVEEGRWQGGDRRFMAGGMAFPTLRTIIAQSTYREPSQTQRSVWENIKTSLGTLRSFSATQSMADLYCSVEDDIESIVAHMRCEANQMGAAVVVGGRYFCLDIFGSPSLFREFFPLLSRSYAMDALLSSGMPGMWDFLDTLPHRLSDDLRKASLRDSPLGDRELILVGEHFQGQMLSHRHNLVHISSFAEIH